MSLPLPVIDRLFERLHLTYGRDFLSTVEGQDMSTIKSFWSHELAGFANNLTAIGKALEILPERVPNVVQFKNICMRQLPDDAVALPPPAKDPAFVRAVLEAIERPQGATNHKAWAKALKARHEAGHKLNANQVRCYKNALGLHPSGAQL